MSLTHTDEHADGHEMAHLRARILDAALAELMAKEVAAFRLDGVAARAGVDPQILRSLWPNANRLYVAALSAWGLRLMPVPDTGSLRGDWVAFSRSFVVAMNSESGRRILAAMVVLPRDWDVAGLRETFREARSAQLGVMVRRAVARGECPEGTDADFVTELFTAGMSVPLMFRGEPLTDEYAERIIDVLIEGIRIR